MQIYLEISVHNIQNTTISYQKPRLRENSLILQYERF